MKFYCDTCGQPTEGIKMPKFCSECSKPFLASTAVASVSPPAPIVKERVRPTRQVEPVTDEDDDDYEDQPTSVPKLKGLDVEISASNGSLRNRQSFDSLVTSGQNTPPPVREPVKRGRGRPSTKAPKVDNTAFLEEFRREAGTLRKK